MDASPRVGDGLIRLDADGVVQYASPNALSAYHRLGLAADLVGHHLGRTTAELAPSRGPVDEALATLASGWAPREAEVENNDCVVQLRTIPLKPKGARIGSLVLLRDVTELRRRERELLTKDATIREIHHRVKNNLQTVAALLRLQARRMDGVTEGRSAREALDEAVRRVGSIAIVHETLSQNLDERVEFDEIADRVVAMVAEISRAGSPAAVRAASASSARTWPPARHGPHRTPPERPGTRLRAGRAGHRRGRGGARRDGAGHLRRGRRDPADDAESVEDRLLVTVEDDGRGLPEGFDPHRAGNLGLQIVRTLVEGSWAGPSTWSRRRSAAPASSSTFRSGPRALSPGPQGPGLKAHLLCASGLLSAAARGHGAAGVRRWRCVPGCERRGASSRGARPR
ncbi:histidine kinase dimerization/phosphoacceptor domain -containing protein [Streptomyces sp. M19]